MLIRLTILCAGIFLFAANARPGASLDFQSAITARTHYSLSGEFIVRDPPSAVDYFVPAPNETNLIHLDPALVAVSCDRIKKALLEQLGARDQWRDRILLDLRHAQSPADSIVVIPTRYAQNWSYQMQLPDTLERSRFIAALVEITLLEMANRNSAQSTEIPGWLVQGLARQIQLSAQSELVVEPPHTAPNGSLFSYHFNSSRRTDPLAAAHAEFHATAPLTLQQLSWPADWQFNGDSGEAYRNSAQLFVSGLLQIKDGRANLQAFLPELPQHLNWQIAFLQAFRSDFANQLQLEKWWALRTVEFTGRDLTQTWPADESWNKLDEIVRPVIQVRARPNDPPVRAQITLDQVIRDWEMPRQKDFLRDKSRQLTMFRVSVSQDLVFLVDDYRHILDSYLARRDNTIYIPMGNSMYPPKVDDFTRSTLRQLAELENRRTQLRPKPHAPLAATVSGLSH